MFSWFKKKQPPVPKVDLSNLPALNAWDVFFQGNGFNLYSRYAAPVPGSHSQQIYLKSYPEVPQLERAVYADWLFIAFTGASEGLFLQRMDADGITLMFIRFSDREITIVKTGLAGLHSAVLTDSATVTFILGGTSFTVNTGTINPEL